MVYRSIVQANQNQITKPILENTSKWEKKRVAYSQKVKNIMSELLKECNECNTRQIEVLVRMALS
jgi:hypothetical protein